MYSLSNISLSLFVDNAVFEHSNDIDKKGNF